jgi:hypothetical protein
MSAPNHQDGQDVASQNHVVRRVSLRFTRPTFELLEVPIIVEVTDNERFQRAPGARFMLGVVFIDNT